MPHPRLHNMVNYDPLTAEISQRVWGTQEISMRFASLLYYFPNLINSIQQRAPRTFSWAAITLGISPHSSYKFTAKSALKEFLKIGQHLHKLQARMLISSSALYARPLSCRRNEEFAEAQTKGNRNCCD